MVQNRTAPLLDQLYYPHIISAIYSVIELLLLNPTQVSLGSRLVHILSLLPNFKSYIIIIIII